MCILFASLFVYKWILLSNISTCLNDLNATLHMYLSLAIVSNEIKWGPYLIFKMSSNSTKCYVCQKWKKFSDHKEMSLISKVSEEQIQH